MTCWGEYSTPFITFLFVVVIVVAAGVAVLPSVFWEIVCSVDS